MKFIILLCLASVAFGATGNRSNTPLEPIHSIIGGEDAKDHEALYQVALEIQSAGQFCGGAIIHERWILTAAHCLIRLNAHQIQVRYNSKTRNSGGEVVPVSRIIRHEYFRSSPIDNDIALLYLAAPMKLNRATGARTIALPLADNDPVYGTSVMISGWGVGSRSNHLQVVSVPIVHRAACANAYRGYFMPIRSNMFCAGLLGVGGKDSCHGDSGSPVVQFNQLVGVVSWGRGCAHPQYPGVYTRVGSYIYWIRSKGVPV